MNTPLPPGAPPDLRRLKLAFLAALERGESPRPWLAAYPAYAGILADLAVASAAPSTPAPPAEVDAAAAILRATLQAHLTGMGAREPGLAARIAARGLRLPAVAAHVRLPPEILFKIDRRIIPLDTIPSRLLHALAALLECPIAALCASLAGSGPRTAGALYHATRPPAVRQQPFAEAVRTSLTIDPADQAYWLAAVDAPCPPGGSAPPPD
jgi:hypothetical protein